MHDAAAKEEARLRELATRHAVRFEVRHQAEMVGDRRMRVGFGLQLYALHENPQRLMPGCPECAKVYADLHEIAQWILPREIRASRYEIEPFDRELHMAPDLKDRDEVRLVVKIVHRGNYLEPIDACEERCLSDMRQKLERLGLREGQRPRRSMH